MTDIKTKFVPTITNRFGADYSPDNQGIFDAAAGTELSLGVVEVHDYPLGINKPTIQINLRVHTTDTSKQPPQNYVLSTGAEAEAIRDAVDDARQDIVVRVATKNGKATSPNVVRTTLSTFIQKGLVMPVVIPPSWQNEFPLELFVTMPVDSKVSAHISGTYIA